MWTSVAWLCCGKRTFKDKIWIRANTGFVQRLISELCLPQNHDGVQEHFNFRSTFITKQCFSQSQCWLESYKIHKTLSTWSEHWVWDGNTGGKGGEVKKERLRCPKGIQVNKADKSKHLSGTETASHQRRHCQYFHYVSFCGCAPICFGKWHKPTLSF